MRTGDAASADRGHLSQQTRLLTGLTYVLGLFVVSYLIDGHWLPSFALGGLWLYGAFLPLLVARHIIEHWFARPADVLANGLALLTASATLSSTGTTLTVEQMDVSRVAVGAYAAGILVLAVIAMLGRTRGGLLGVMAPRATRIAELVGQAQVGFSVYLALVTLAAYANDHRVVALVATAWVVIVLMRPADWVASRLREWRPPLPRTPEVSLDGVVDPRLIRALTRPDASVRIGDGVEWTSGARGTVVDRSELLDEIRLLVALDEPGGPPHGRARVVAPVARSSSSVIGFVAADSSIHELVARSTAIVDAIPEVSEGRLLAARIRGRETYFQITAASVDEVTELGVRRNFVSIRARKLGVWSEAEHGFSLVPWVPDAGTDVRLIEQVDDEASIASGVGRLPGTSYRVGIDVERAVLYNTAILGILGVGKTSLAWELVQRMLCEGIRVVIVDITGEYSIRFREIWSEQEEANVDASIAAKLAVNRERKRVPREQAGNWSDVKPAMRDLFDQFVQSDSRLLILNPSRIDATAEDGFPQGGEVPLRRLTNVEVVRLIAEELLDFARTTTPADPSAKLKPRFCLVLEEAHSLVPEGGSTADRSDQTATAGTARAVLQGRKYGLGCLLITQRTANVTKTILNQCHTVFAMRSFDATSETFLANYLGREYAGLLSTLKDRQAVLFGRASTSSAPVLIDLNDRDRFTDEFWANCKGAVPSTELGRRAEGEPSGLAPEVDDGWEPDWEEDEDPGDPPEWMGESLPRD